MQRLRKAEWYSTGLTAKAGCGADAQQGQGSVWNKVLKSTLVEEWWDMHWVSVPKQKWKDICTRRQQQCWWWHAGDKQNRWLEKRYIKNNRSHGSRPSTHSSATLPEPCYNCPTTTDESVTYSQHSEQSCVRVCTHIYVCMHAYICICVCIYIHTHTHICMNHHLTEEAASLTKAGGSIYTDKYLERSLTTWPLSKTVSISSPLEPMTSQDLGFQYFQFRAWLQSWGTGLKSSQESGWSPYKLPCLYCNCSTTWLAGQCCSMQYWVKPLMSLLLPTPQKPTQHLLAPGKLARGRENSLVSSRIDFIKSYNQCSSIFSNRVLESSCDG